VVHADGWEPFALSPCLWSRLVAEPHVEPFAKVVDLSRAKRRVLLVAEVVAGVGFAQFQRVVEADGSAAVHLRLPLFLHEAQAMEHAGEFAARDVLVLVCRGWDGSGRHVQLVLIHAVGIQGFDHFGVSPFVQPIEVLGLDKCLGLGYVVLVVAIDGQLNQTLVGGALRFMDAGIGAVVVVRRQTPNCDLHKLPFVLRVSGSRGVGASSVEHGGEMVGIGRVSGLALEFDGFGYAGLDGCAVGQLGSGGGDAVAVEAIVRETQQIPVERAEEVEQGLAGLPFVFGDQEAALQILGVNLDEFHVFLAVNGWVESAS
jgi:hypothetical protein